ncbi:YesL family protein [Lachnospiraceae bacterium C1.1]|nr:YesL family protein [Lachnospiraceae bacterium C1.1]
MGGIFNYDGPLFRFLDKAVNIIILNVLFLICSIPIFTIGASMTALYYMTLKLAAGEEGYIVQGFFKSFKQNFKQATIIWLIMMLIAVVFRLDFYAVNSFGATTFSTVLRVGLIAIFIIWLIELSYVFPVLSHFENTVKATMKNALAMAIASLPMTVIIFLIWSGAGFIEYIFFWRAVPIILMVGFSGPAFLSSFVFRKVFKKYQ